MAYHRRSAASSALSIGMAQRPRSALGGISAARRRRRRGGSWRRKIGLSALIVAKRRRHRSAGGSWHRAQWRIAGSSAALGGIATAYIAASQLISGSALAASNHHRGGSAALSISSARRRRLGEKARGGLGENNRRVSIASLGIGGIARGGALLGAARRIIIASALGIGIARRSARQRQWHRSARRKLIIRSSARRLNK